ncbi:hypothetical protein DFQ30_001580, partial [Apophysomyces sp. BC1015]
MKPKLNNLDPHLYFNEIQCKRHRIDPSLAGIPARKWRNIDTLVDAILQHHQTKYKNPHEALKLIFGFLQGLVNRHQQFLSLQSYCADLIAFLKTKPVKDDFNRIYKQKWLQLEATMLEQSAQQLGYNNGILLSISGATTYKTKLETALDSSSEQQPSASTTSSAPASASSSSYSSSAPVSQWLEKSERDSFYVGDDDDNTTCTSDRQRVSVGTIIKRKALDLHQRVCSGTKLTAAAQTDCLFFLGLCSSGLSSILDLVDHSGDGQASLFSKQEWKHITDHFTKQYQADSYVLPELIRDTWKIVAEIGKRDNSIENCRAYLLKLILRDTLSVKSKKMLRTLALVLDTIEYQAFLLDPSHAVLISESDYLMKIWGPLFDAILSVNNNLVRLKSGECTNNRTALMKQELYHDDDHVVGFKVDFRFIFDAKCGHGVELDVGAGEAARNNNDTSKLYKDLGKLLREGKDVVDGLLVNTLDEETVCRTGAWIIQIVGLHAEISSLHLAHDGLYVCVPQGKLTFPSHASNLYDFIYTLENIFLMVSKLEENALALQANVEFLEHRKRSIGKAFDRSIPFNKKQHTRKHWTRPT